ncbi:hypothetical protein [Marinactinospora rubrisoli]|uniref:Uncharacterized protein n=1 Tax=Marinactinospora rubrisoli TaxID=2715399 RepID=A0ABW2KMN7_9ACTN
MPAPGEVAEYGRFPETFVGSAGHRHPVAVEPLNHGVHHPEAPWTSALPPGEVADQVGRLLADVLGSGAEPLDEAARELAAALAREVAAGFRDLVRVHVAAEPGGSPLDGELHLLGRDLGGRTLRLSVAPAPSGPPPDGRWPDPRRARDGEIAPAGIRTEAEYRQAALAVRADCAAALLGEFVWLTNNDRMDMRAWAEPLGLDVDLAAVDTTDAAVRAWWPRSELREWSLAEEWWGEDDEDAEPEPRRLDEETLAAVLAEFEEHNMAQARSGAWAMGEIGDYDVDDDPQPSFPGDRLVGFLGRDLVATVTARVADGSDGARPLAYGIGLPFDAAGEDDGVRACLLLVGSAAVGVIAIDATA